MKTPITIFQSLALAAILAVAAQASVQINLGGSDLTNTPPSATVPNDAITLLFENTATTNTVKLTIDVTGTSLKVKTILFNVDPLITGFNFVDVSGPTATKSFAADGKGMGGPLTGFDISFDFSTSGANGALWNGSAPAVFEITRTAGTATLTENSFSYTNPNSHFGAVHINLPNGEGPSGKYGSTTDGVVPEPGTIAVWGLLAMTGYFGMKKREAKA